MTEKEIGAFKIMKEIKDVYVGFQSGQSTSEGFKFSLYCLICGHTWQVAEKSARTTWGCPKCNDYEKIERMKANHNLDYCDDPRFEEWALSLSLEEVRQLEFAGNEEVEYLFKVWLKKREEGDNKNKSLWDKLSKPL